MLVIISFLRSEKTVTSLTAVSVTVKMFSYIIFYAFLMDERYIKEITASNVKMKCQKYFNIMNNISFFSGENVYYCLRNPE